MKGVESRWLFGLLFLSVLELTSCGLSYRKVESGEELSKAGMKPGLYEPEPIRPDFFGKSNKPKLKEDGYGEMPLGGANRLDLAEVKNYFPGTTIIENIGQEDGRPFKYYDIIKGTAGSVFIRMSSKNDKKVNRLFIFDKGVADVYGVKPGMTVKSAQRKRKGLSLVQDSGEQFLVAKRSKILYLIEENTENNSDDLKNRRIAALVWNGSSK
ncbi:hypothetical protein [Fulvitalea axinellae]